MSTALDRHLAGMDRRHNRRTTLAGAPVAARLQHLMELLADVRDVLLSVPDWRVPADHRHAIDRAAQSNRKAMQTLRSIAAPAELDCPQYRPLDLSRLEYARIGLRTAGYSYRTAAAALGVSATAVTSVLTGHTNKPELLARIEALQRRKAA